MNKDKVDKVARLLHEASSIINELLLNNINIDDHSKLVPASNHSGKAFKCITELQNHLKNQP